MESKIKGLAKGLVEEVIKADMSMQASQIEAWTWITKHRPRGVEIPGDVFLGIPESRYLSLNEVSFEAYLRPLTSRSFWQRFRLGFKLMFGNTTFRENNEYAFEFCSNSDKSAQKMNIIIKRLENGKIKADYLPLDEKTADIMKS